MDFEDLLSPNSSLSWDSERSLSVSIRRNGCLSKTQRLTGLGQFVNSQMTSRQTMTDYSVVHFQNIQFRSTNNPHRQMQKAFIRKSTNNRPSR